MLIKRAWLKICVSIVTTVALLFCGFFVGNLVNHRLPATEKVESKGQGVSSKGQNVSSEQQSTALDSFNIKKTSMKHTDTLSFSWKVSTQFGAKTTDYLAPQLKEIFEVTGIETTGKFVIKEDVAKHISDTISLMRCFNVIDKSNGEGIALLCYTAEKENEMFVSVQVINKSISHVNDFSFADFNGDGTDEVYTSCAEMGADNGHSTVGVFPFSEGKWGKPLFWSVDGENPLPYNFGFSVKGDTTKRTIENTNTGYRRTIRLKTGDGSYLSDLKYMLICSSTAADVDGDGVYELIIDQQPFRWSGSCFSLLKYNTVKKCFKTKYASYLTFDEAGQDGFKSFLQKAGYRYSNIKFID